ncbi:MAG TPA: hypothetical protein VGF66_11000 [Gaiellaceae bacterium]|jgi:hypothetical protein
MGLWVQGIGVRGQLPEGVPGGDDDFALSWKPAAGWSWATLSEDWERDLEQVATDVASAASAPVLTYLIADSDLVVLHGAAPGGTSVVASSGEYEEPGPPTQTAAFAEWTERHAPAAVAAERFHEWSRTQYVFAEEALAYLLGQMGLVEPTEPPETLDG